MEIRGETDTDAAALPLTSHPDHEVHNVSRFALPHHVCCVKECSFGTKKFVQNMFSFKTPVQRSETLTSWRFKKVGRDELRVKLQVDQSEQATKHLLCVSCTRIS